MGKVKTAVLIASPHAGHHRDALDQAKALLAARDIRLLHIYHVADLDGLPPQGIVWRAQGVDMVIAAGGDGTIGAVATHLAGSGVPLAILPLGTSNDFARALSLPLSLDAAVRVIVAGIPSPIDLGVAIPAATAPFALHNRAEAAATGQPTILPVIQHEQAYFVHALTLGLNVAFAKLATNVAMRQRYGPLTYPLAALEALTEYRSISVKLTFEGLLPYAQGAASVARPVERYECCYRALQVAAINTPIFGGRLQLDVPDVAMDDGIIDVIIIEDLNLADLIAAVKAAAARDLARLKTVASTARNRENEQLSNPDELFLPGVRRFKTRAVTLEPEEPVDATLDGEIRARAPLRVSVARGALQVLVPPPVAPGETPLQFAAQRAQLFSREESF